MSAEQREEAVFEAALQLPADQRAAYLDQTCAGDADLRRHVEVLLGAFQRAGGFMNQAATPERTVKSSLPPTEKPGDKIGRYKLMEQIGEGGCGVVYVAEQEEPVRRRVALKVIKLGMDTKQVIARFDAERQALAMMDHPNIAKIFDAGVTDASLPDSGHLLPVGRGEGPANSQPSTLNSQLSPGRPYFIMELVRGIKITDYCDQNHLSPRERLDLFIQVCRAIQHAHQKGVIHRDIKPSNILVTLHDGVPVPKVIDFGIAKATQGRLTDQTVYTAFEQFIGTPAYMSPEQAELSGLDIDTRSDIYSLGVLLYELLTGKTPFDAKELLAAGLDEMRRTIREVEPIKPSTRLTQEIVGDDVRRLTSKSETREPKSEEAIRASSRRLLQTKDLIHALRGDLDWIVMKCLEKDRTRRYETANGLATDITRHLSNEPVVARPPSRLYRFQKTAQRNKLAFGAATSVALALVIGLAVSTVMYFKAQTEKKRAQMEAARSTQVALFMKDLLNGVEPSVALGRDTTLLREIFDKTAERIGKELTNQPQVEAELRSTIGTIYFGLGVYPKAIVMHREALRLRKSLFGDTNELVALSLCELGWDLEQTGDRAQSEAMMRQALVIRRQLFGDLHPRVANSLWALGDVLLGGPRTSGKLEEAETALEEAVTIQQRVLNKDDPDLAGALQTLGGVLNARGKLTEAEKFQRQALDMWTRLRGDENPEVASSLMRLGAVLATQGKLTEAEAAQRKAFALRRASLREGHPWVTSSMVGLALTLRKQGKVAEAVSLYLEDVKRGSIPAMNSLAWVLATAPATQFRDGSNAVQWAERAVAATGRTNGMYLDTLAAGYAELGQFDTAVRVQKDALALSVAEDEKKDYAVRLRLYESNAPYRDDREFAFRTTSLLAAGKFVEAESLGHAWLALCEKQTPDDWRTFSARSMLGGSLLGQRKYFDAESLLLSGYEGMKQTGARASDYEKVQLKEALHRLVQLYEATTRPDQAAEWKRKLAEFDQTSQ